MEPTADSVEHRASIVARFATGWRTDLDNISEQLAWGWRAHLERAVDEGVRSLNAQHAAQQKRLIERLAQGMRRLRQFENESQWSAALADAAHLGAKRVIVFSINTDKLHFQAARGIEIAELADVPLSDAAAFAAAVQSSEPAVALKLRSELSAPVIAQVGEDANVKCSLYPVTTRQRVAAIVYAEEANPTLLDLIVTAAGASLEGHMAHNASRGTSNVVSITPAAGTPFISRDEEERHSRAQRFARVQVAEIRLYHSQAVKAGRADSNIYKALKPQIDEVRRIYQEQYLKDAPNMVDYLHQEILRTLANGNAELLGPEYPSPLV